MGQWVRAQGRPNWPKFAKHALIVTSPSENPTENEKRFFLMSTRRLAESVKGLNSSLAAGDLWPKKGRPIVAVQGLNLKP